MIFTHPEVFEISTGIFRATLLGSKCSQWLIGTTTKPVGFCPSKVVLGILNIHNIECYVVIHISVAVLFFFFLVSHFSKLSSNLKVAQEPSTYMYINNTKSMYIQCYDIWPWGLRLQLLLQAIFVQYLITRFFEKVTIFTYFTELVDFVVFEWFPNDSQASNSKVITGNRRKWQQSN